MAGIILASVAAPRSVVPHALSLSPVRYVGRISYGLYIWHWPIFISHQAVPQRDSTATSSSANGSS